MSRREEIKWRAERVQGKLRGAGSNHAHHKTGRGRMATWRFRNGQASHRMVENGGRNGTDKMLIRKDLATFCPTALFRVGTFGEDLARLWTRREPFVIRRFLDIGKLAVPRIASRETPRDNGHAETREGHRISVACRPSPVLRKSVQKGPETAAFGG